MDTQIVLVFCLCDDLLKGLHHIEDRQSQLSDAEVMTAVIVSAQVRLGIRRAAQVQPGTKIASKCSSRHGSLCSSR